MEPKDAATATKTSNFRSSGERMSCGTYFYTHTRQCHVSGRTPLPQHRRSLSESTVTPEGWLLVMMKGERVADALIGSFAHNTVGGHATATDALVLAIATTRVLEELVCF